MPWSNTPSVLFGTSYSATTTSLTLAVANFSELASDEINATSGDSRKIIYGIVEGLYQRYNALPSDNKSNKMEITRARSLNENGTINSVYTISFTLSAGSVDVQTPD